MTERRKWKTAALIATWACAVAPAWALDGVVVDDKGVALAGAQVCYVVGGRNTLCGGTDAAGRFEIPDSQLTQIRITRPGFLPRTVAAVRHPVPIGLMPAARLQLRLVGEDGAALDGKVYLIGTNGRRRGPLPVNRNGLLLKTIKPGEYRVSAEVEGYVQKKAHTLRLEPRKTADETVMLEPVPAEGTPRSD